MCHEQRGGWTLAGDDGIGDDRRRVHHHVIHITRRRIGPDQRVIDRREKPHQQIIRGTERLIDPARAIVAPQHGVGKGSANIDAEGKSAHYIIQPYS